MPVERRINLYPWSTIVKAWNKILANNGADMPLRQLVGPDAKVQLFQQFQCAKCKAKQTMPDPNILYQTGKCEECGHVTNIMKDGCNYMATFTRPTAPQTSNRQSPFPTDQ